MYATGKRESSACETNKEPVGSLQDTFYKFPFAKGLFYFLAIR